jgi:hypothetical protein
MRSASAIVALILLIGGCATADPTGPQSPRGLYREYVTRLAAVDARGICALFTPDGATSFTSAYSAGTCPAAADRAASAGGDLSSDLAMVDTIPIAQEGTDYATIGDATCSLGRFIAQKAGSGWLFIGHTPRTGTCDDQSLAG